jgi:hypothetical protein
MNTFTQYDFRTSFCQCAEDNRSIHAWMMNIYTRGSLDAPEFLPAGSHVCNHDGEAYSRFVDRRDYA